MTDESLSDDGSPAHSEAKSADTEDAVSSDPETVSSYVPIACGFYDELGLRMMRGSECTIVTDGGGEGREDRTLTGAVIEDLYTEGDAEYVRLAGGEVIRLDRIQAVDDVERPGAC